MPQMAPLSWSLLYFMFICLFLLFIIMNYFNFLYMPKKKKKNLKAKTIYWKW